MTSVRAIIGPPGTGKTSTIASEVSNLCSDDPKAAMICSLTRNAAAAAAGKDMAIDPQMVGTLHSFAWRSLEGPDMTEDRLSDFSASHAIFRLSGSGKATDPYSEPGDKTHGDACLSAYDLLRNRLVPREKWPAHVLSFAKAWESWKAETGLMDFSDLLERCIEEVPVAPFRPRHLFLDEAQDSSKLQMELLRRWGAAADELVIVGDPRQSIFRFAGSYPEMFRKIDRVDVLEQSHRVPKTVHQGAEAWYERASDHFPVSWRPRDDAGEIGTSRALWKNPGALLGEITHYLEQGLSVLVMTACVYQLNPLLVLLRRAAIPFGNRLRRKEGRWNPLGPRRGISTLDRLTALLRPSGWTWADLRIWTEPLRSGDVLKRGVKKALMEIDERYLQDVVPSEHVAALFSSQEWADRFDFSGSPRDVIQSWREALLKSRTSNVQFAADVVAKHGLETAAREPKLQVGTVHSYKGGEADVVFLFPDLSPRGWKEWSSPGEGRDELVRLGYVAMTRARHRLVLCQRSGYQALPLRSVLS
jgi:superfamily I DNA/RNA helicase